MNTASRIKLARQLIYCAKMILDAGQFKEVKTDIISKKIVADYAYDKFKQYISTYEIESKTLLDYVKRYGIDKINGSGYVLHHFNNSPTHYIQNGKKSQKYQIYMDILEDKRNNPKMKKQLQEQIQHLVLLPEWFHNYIKDNQQAKTYTNRQGFYNLLKSVLLQKEAYDEIKALKFDGTSIPAAIKSIKNLAIVIHGKSQDIIDYLSDAYDLIKQSLIDQLLK